VVYCRDKEWMWSWVGALCLSSWQKIRLGSVRLDSRTPTRTSTRLPHPFVPNEYSHPPPGMSCHPERSEGSAWPGTEILRCAQDDMTGFGYQISSGWRMQISYLTRADRDGSEIQHDTTREIFPRVMRGHSTAITRATSSQLHSTVACQERSAPVPWQEQ